MSKHAINDFSENSLCVFDTSFCLILTKQKIGTQFTRTFFSEDLNKNLVPPEFDITPSYTINYTGSGLQVKEKYPPDCHYTEKFKYHLESLERFLNNPDFDKDVVVLIRDPWKRFVSAFIQDFVKPFIGPNNSRIIEVLGQITLSEDKLTWWINNRHEIDEFTRDQDRLQTPSDKFIECFEDIVESILDGWRSGKYEILSLHNSAYLSLLSSLLLSNPNRNKVKIFDIDEVDLNDVFITYAPHLKKVEKENSSNILTEITLKVINKYPSIKNMVISKLTSETIAYNNLKKLK